MKKVKNFKIVSFPKIFGILVCIGAIFLPMLARAATLSFDPESTIVGTSGSFSVGLNITADNPINALSLTLKLPEGIEPLDISDGNSIVNYWIDKPVYDASRKIVTFSGIIPGGFSGKNGRLLLIHFRALHAGNFILDYDEAVSKIYLNTPDAIADTISVEPLQFNAEASKENIQNIIPDTTPPEDFSVEISQNALAYGSSSVAVFATQDKGVGMYGYEAAESKLFAKDFGNLDWQKTDSPYVVKDQSGRSYVYIKAIDKNGNSRIEYATPEHPYSWWELYNKYILVSIIGIILIMTFFMLRRKKNLILFLLIAVFSFGMFSLASPVDAATLYFSNPDSYTIGQTVTLSAYVSTSQAMNAVSGTISYPQDKLQLLSLSKAGSIITFWTQEPSFGNGQALFEGVAYNPGYTGAAGKLITLVFKVKSAGSARISFSSASVLANDGQGTNILDTTKDVTLSLGDAPAEAVPPPASSNPTSGGLHVYSPTHPDPEKWYPSGSVTMKWDVPGDASAVRIRYDKLATSEPNVVYEPPISEKSFSIADGVWYFHAQEQNAEGWGPITHFRLQIDTAPPGPVSVEFPNGISGVDPRPEVKIEASDALSGIDHYDIRVGSSGIIHVDPSDAESGQYRLPLQDPGTKKLEVTAYDKAGNSSSNDVDFEVVGSQSPTNTLPSPATFKMGGLEISDVTLLSIILALLIGLIMWMLYLWHKLMNIRNRVIKKVEHADSVLRKKFDSLKDSVVDEVRRLESAQKKRKLSAEEEAVIKSLRKSLTDAEVLLEEEIENIKNF